MSYLPKPTEGGDFKPCPVGTHLGVCVRVIDLGTQESTFGGKTNIRHKVMISWELPDERMDDGRPFMVSKRYTWSMHEKATLRKDLEAWRGVPFKDSDFGEGGFDIRNVLAKPCLVSVTHDERDGKTYSNVASVSKIMKGMNAPAPENEPVLLWLDPETFDVEVFDKLSDGLKDTIRKSPEFRAIQASYNSQPDSPNYREELEDSIPF
jgi:hypothetical protein